MAAIIAKSEEVSSRSLAHVAVNDLSALGSQMTDRDAHASATRTYSTSFGQ